MSDVVLVDASNWEDEVEKSDKPVLVQFSAKGCAPCNALRPRVAAVAAQNNQVLKVAEVKVDQAPELMEKFSIRAVPALKLFKDGKVVKEHVGLVDKAALDEFIVL